MIATTHDLQEQIEQIDAKVIDLLEYRWRLCNEVDEEVVEQRADSIMFWAEEAAERGMSEDAAERICRSIISLCRKGPE